MVDQVVGELGGLDMLVNVNFRSLQFWRCNARWSCLVVAVLAATGLVVVILWLLVVVWQPPSVQTRIRVEADLPACSLNESDLPDGWKIRNVSSYDSYQRVLPGRALGGIRAGFYPGGSQIFTHSGHGILLYRTAKEAESQFERQIVSYSSQFYKSWVEIDVSEAGLSADQYRLVCAEFVSDTRPGEDKLCLAKARYDRFLSLLDAGVSPRKMSMAEVVQTLQAIDKHMLKCVDVLCR